MQRITRAEIARLAGVSRAAVTQWGKRNRGFPRPGDDGRFALAEVLEWLERQRVRAADRETGDQIDESYANRVRRNLAAAAPAELPAMQLPGDGPTTRADNLTLLLTLVFLRTQDPQAWTEIDQSITPDAEAVGARWLLAHIAAVATRAARRHGLSPEIFVNLRRLAPERVSQVRALMRRCTKFGAADVQAIIDEYETVLSPGAFLTPRAVATLLAEMVIDDAAESVYDPHLRGGELLIAAADAAHPRRPRLHGIAPHATALSLSGLNLLARDETADLRPAHESHPAPVTHVLANPPFGIESWIDYRPDTDWHPFPRPPARSTFRWLLHCLKQLRDGGRIAIIMPPSAAISANTRERELRRQLIDQSMVEAVLALPRGLLVGRDIATSVWIVRHAPDSDQPILFIDAARLGVPGDRRTVLDEAGRAAILSAWRLFLADREAGRTHHGVDRLSVAVPRTSIRADTYSLNPAEYVSGRIGPLHNDNNARTGLRGHYQRALDCWTAADEAAAAVYEPSGAQIVRLGDVCEVKAGYSYSLLPAGQRDRQYGVPIVLPRHLRDGRIVADNPPCAPHRLATALADYAVRDGDVLCVRTGALTQPALVRPEDAGRLVSTNLLRLRVHDPKILDPYVLYAYLRSAAGTKQMKTFARSTATAYVTASDVDAMEIPLPPPERQRALTAALRALDEEVRATRDLATAVAAARDTAIHQIVGGAL